MSGPSAEEFARWRDDRVTQWVFKALQTRVEEQRQLWISASWQGGKADPLILKELQSRATAFVEVFDNPYENWCATNGDEPSYDDR